MYYGYCTVSYCTYRSHCKYNHCMHTAVYYSILQVHCCINYHCKPHSILHVHYSILHVHYRILHVYYSILQYTACTLQDTTCILQYTTVYCSVYYRTVGRNIYLSRAGMERSGYPACTQATVSRLFPTNQIAADSSLAQQVKHFNKLDIVTVRVYHFPRQIGILRSPGGHFRLRLHPLALRIRTLQLGTIHTHDKQVASALLV